MKKKKAKKKEERGDQNLTPELSGVKRAKVMEEDPTMTNDNGCIRRRDRRGQEWGRGWEGRREVREVGSSVQLHPVGANVLTRGRLWGVS